MSDKAELKLLHKSKRVDIEFERISLSVKQGKGKKQVLKGVSGKFKSGELTAIMGPSGAGKTSLLNILTGFQLSGVDGTIRCSNSRSKSKGTLQFNKDSCYILQDDQLNPYFTVKEYMQMAADLKLGKQFSKKAKSFLINEILETLGLENCKETRAQRLSGGQRKRLSIALELIDNPPVMFLDEPTTGLDSSSTTQCIKMLKDLAKGGRTIICTIHQPSASIYELFDQVYVLAEGKCVYQGSALNTVPYLSSCGFNCPQYHNPADYMIEVANAEYGNYTDFLSSHVNKEKWISSPTSESKDQCQLGEETNYIYSEDCEEKIRPSELSKFYTLLKRTCLHICRDWTVSFLKLGLHLIVGVFLGLTYQNAGNDGSKTLNNVGFLIISAVYLIYTSLMPAVLKFPSEIGILKKERFNNWYKLRTYYAAFLVADIPLQIIYSVTYTGTSYLITSQPSEWSRFYKVQGILILVSLIASSMGLVLGAMVNPVNGTFLGAIITAFMLSLAGFLVLFTHMSKVMYALTYVSYIAFAYEALVYAVYGYNRSPLHCPEEVEYCHYKFPAVILEDFGMTKNNFWIDFTYLLLNFMLLRGLAFFTLKKKLSPS